MLSLSDPALSRAVLVGVHSCADIQLADLKSVPKSVERLKELLCDKSVWGLAENHCQVILQPNRNDITGAVRKAAEEAEDTLLIYYAGHGITPRANSSLYLTLPESRSDRFETALAYEEIRGILLEPRGYKNAPRIVIILDCCWSGAALGGTMGERENLAQKIRVQGAFVFTACAETQQALAPEGETYTAFTGELIQVIENGIGDSGDFLSMSAVYRQVRDSLLEKGRPEPQHRSTNQADNICLFRNLATVARPPAPTDRQPASDSLLTMRVAPAARGAERLPPLLPVITPSGPVARLGSHLVTNVQFEAFLRDPANKRWRPENASADDLDADDKYLWDWTDGRMPQGREEYPVVNVSVPAARAYLAWAGGQLGLPLRLPTSREWEIAAGMGSNDDWWRNEIAAGRVNYSGTRKKLSRVGVFGQNERGFHDLLGNAWDICTVEETGAIVLRGGSYLTSKNRLTEQLELRALGECQPDVGFRGACDIDQS